MALPWTEPIIPTRRREPFDHPDWLFDVKYDGFRALCFLEQWRGYFGSRNGKPLNRFTVLADELAEVLEVDEAVIDGEVIVADDSGRPQFYDLLRGRRTPVYVAFDLLWRDGVDLRPLPLSERRSALRGLLAKGSPDPVISEAVSVEGRGCELFELMCANDLEGSSPSAAPIPTARAPAGGRSKTRITRRPRAGPSSSTGRDIKGSIRVMPVPCG